MPTPTMFESLQRIGYTPEMLEVAFPQERRRELERPRELAEVRRSTEAASTGDTLSLTVIKAGLNLAGSRFYTEAALRGGVELFQGKKMYLDHQTAAQERERPEGSIRDWAAVITGVSYDAAAKSIRATAKLIDPTFKEKVASLARAGLLHTLGVSIRAVGSGEAATVEGVSTFRVDQFAEVISVDFVTEPGAGGRVELLESTSGRSPRAARPMSESLRRLGFTDEQIATAIRGR